MWRSLSLMNLTSYSAEGPGPNHHWGATSNSKTPGNFPWGSWVTLHFMGELCCKYVLTCRNSWRSQNLILTKTKSREHFSVCCAEGHPNRCAFQHFCDQMRWENRAHVGPGLFVPLLLTWYCGLNLSSIFWFLNCSCWHCCWGKDWVPNWMVKSGAGARGILGPQLRDWSVSVGFQT